MKQKQIYLFIYLKSRCFFCNSRDVGNLMSGSSAFSESSCTSGSSLEYGKIRNNTEILYCSVPQGPPILESFSIAHPQAPALTREKLQQLLHPMGVTQQQCHICKANFPPKVLPTTDFLHLSSQAISRQSEAVFILRLLSNPHNSNSQSPWTPVDLPPYPGYARLWRACLCGSYSIQTTTNQLLYSPTASDASLCPNRLPRMWGSLPCFCSPTPRTGQSHSLSSSFPFFTSSFQAVEWIHIFLSSGQGILPLFSWYSVRNAASINIFMRHPWREMDSMFTYSSAILLTRIYVYLRKKISISIDFSNTSHVYLLFFENKFPLFQIISIFNTILSFIVTKLYIRSSDLINFILEKV